MGDWLSLECKQLHWWTSPAGSMVGAHYYLLVKELLESKVNWPQCCSVEGFAHVIAQADGRVTQDDYIDLVHTMIAQFSQAAEQVGV